MNKEYKIKLDLNKKLYNKKMTFNQFDENVNDFYIEVTKNNEVIKGLNKSIVTLVAIKPDNTVEAQFIEVENGLVYADLKPSMCDLVGNYQAKAMIVLEGKIITTDTIIYSVNEDKIISRLNEDIVSDERFALFTDALARLSDIEASEEQRIVNEAERILSEENRKIEEAKRVEAELIRQHEEADRAKYDAIRESNENIRKQNESIRLANETNRIDEEAKRVEEETNRVKAEQLRKDNYNFMTEDEERRRSEANAHKEAEVLRVQAETNRVNEEAKRRTTEQARVLAENTRVNNEKTRKANETTRQTNETQRIEAETQRQNRYNSFIADAEANANEFENYTNTAKVKEEERKSNELDRKSQEAKRVSNEVERISNESTRKANENARIESEKQRVDAENLRKEKIIEIQTDYDSLKKVIIDENASANLQNQINQTNSQLEHIMNYYDDEIGVKNDLYPIGDCRRYGIFPDGVTNWNKDTNYISVIQQNSANLGIEIYFPKGIYNTELNITRSNVSLRFAEGCEFTGLIHIGGTGGTSGEKIENIKFNGTICNYDRFGLFNAKNVFVDKIHVKSVPELALNYPGLRTRGVHVYYNVEDFTCNEIVVDDCDQNGFSSDAAVSFDAGATYLAKNIKIGKIHVKKSDIHGVYLMGNGYYIDEIIVDEYGKGEYRPGQSDGNLVGANGNSQSKELKGVWVNRLGDSVINKITVNQNNNDSRPNAKYDILLDETGIAGDKSVKIGSIYCKNTRGVSRGLAIGDKNYPVAHCRYDIDYIELNNEIGRYEDGYSLVSVNPYVYCQIGTINIINADTYEAFRIDSALNCTINTIRCGDVKNRACFINGRLTTNLIECNRIQSGNTPSIEITNGGSHSSINKLYADAKNVCNAQAFKITNSNYLKINYLYTGLHYSDLGTTQIDTCQYSNFDYIRSNFNSSKLGTGLVISNLTGCYLSGSIAYFDKGIVYSGKLTRCSAVNLFNGNNGSMNTNIPLGTLALLGCTNVELTS